MTKVIVSKEEIYRAVKKLGEYPKGSSIVLEATIAEVEEEKVEWVGCIKKDPKGCYHMKNICCTCSCHTPPRLEERPAKIEELKEDWSVVKVIETLNKIIRAINSLTLK